MASDGARELFITGLRNAHAMEHQARELMERQIERSTDYPQVSSGSSFTSRKPARTSSGSTQCSTSWAKATPR